MPLLLSALQLQPVRLQSADDCKIRPLHPPFESSLDRSMGGEKCRRTCLEPHSPFGDKLNLIPSYISLQNGSSVLKRVKASTTRSSLFCRLPRCGVCVSSGPRCEELLCVPPPRARSSARRGMYSFFLFFAPHSSYVPKWTEICKARLVFVVYAPTPFSMTSSVV